MFRIRLCSRAGLRRKGLTPRATESLSVLRGGGYVYSIMYIYIYIYHCLYTCLYTYIYM